MNNTMPGLPGPGADPTQPLSTETRAPLVIGVSSAFMAVVIVFMGVRGYVRGHILKAWGLDDSVFILACLLFIAQCTTVLCNALYGTLGVHIWNATLERLRYDAHYVVATVLVYQVAFSFIKVAFLLQYRRAFAIPSVKMFCDVFIAVVLIIMAGTLLSGGLILRRFLEPDYIPSPQNTEFLAWGYAHSAVNLLTDIIIFILPLPLVSRLKLATMQKVGLIVSFGVGIFTAAISVIRISTLPLGLRSIDINYEAVPLVILTLAEPTSAIICVCVPILRPLMTSSGGSQNNSRGSRRPLSRVTDNSVVRGSMPPQSPTSQTTMEMAQATGIEGSIQGDYEGYVSSQQAKAHLGSSVVGLQDRSVRE